MVVLAAETVRIEIPVEIIDETLAGVQSAARNLEKLKDAADRAGSSTDRARQRVTKFDSVEKEIKKDLPSRLHGRRQILRVLYPVVDVPTEAAGRKRNTKEVDLVAKLFDEYGPRYADRKGGYTRIVKIGPRKGDAAMQVILELV